MTMSSMLLAKVDKGQSLLSGLIAGGSDDIDARSGLWDCGEMRTVTYGKDFIFSGVTGHKVDPVTLCSATMVSHGV